MDDFVDVNSDAVESVLATLKQLQERVFDPTVETSILVLESLLQSVLSDGRLVEKVGAMIVTADLISQAHGPLLELRDALENDNNFTPVMETLSNYEWADQACDVLHLLRSQAQEREQVQLN